MAETWKTLAFYDDVAVLSDAAAADVSNAASAGTGTKASRDDHVHKLGANVPDESTITIAAGVLSVKADGVVVAKLGADLCTANEGIKQVAGAFQIDYDNDTLGIVSNKLDVKADGIGTNEINNAAVDFALAQAILKPKASGAGTVEGSIFYDEDDDHYYLYCA